MVMLACNDFPVSFLTLLFKRFNTFLSFILPLSALVNLNLTVKLAVPRKKKFF